MKRAFTNPALVVLLIYMWWFLTTPYNASRLGFLAEVKFERWLAGAFVILAACSGNLQALAGKVALLVWILFAWMFISAEMSEYQEVAILWKENYWKKLVFFAALTTIFRKKEDFHFVIMGVAGIIFLYQLQTWKEYVQGGAYVYQQGMKRMAGIWSGPGYGAGNAWGNLALFGVPFAVACRQLSTQFTMKALSIGFLASSLLCIAFSGTRGAMITAIFYLVAIYRRSLLRFRYAVLVLFGLLIGLPLLPEAVQNRFLSIVVTKDAVEMTGAEKIAAESAKGRLQGFITGFVLANESPLFGCGPTASAQAAFELQQSTGENADAQPLQLHNLYGQIVGELGYPGLLIWLLLLGTSAWSVRRTIQASTFPNSGVSSVSVIGNLLLGLIAVMAIYGFGSHNLYDVHWLFIFGMVNAFCSLTEPCDQWEQAESGS